MRIRTQRGLVEGCAKVGGYSTDPRINVCQGGTGTQREDTGPFEYVEC